MMPQRILWEYLDDFVLVDDGELMMGVRLHLEKTKTLAEPAGAAPLAAALKLRDRVRGKKIALILSGGNISPEELITCLERTTDAQRRCVGMTSLNLTVMQERLAICRLAADAPLPIWAAGGPLVSITRTADELSIVCLEEQAPDDVTVERGWRCLKVEGPLDFALTGILADLAGVLASAGISIFAISTFDTDYLLVKEETLDGAVEALTVAGHRCEVG